METYDVNEENRINGKKMMQRYQKETNVQATCYACGSGNDNFFKCKLCNVVGRLANVYNNYSSKDKNHSIHD